MLSNVVIWYNTGKKKKDDSESGDTESEAQRSETEEILDSILPPREWEENGQLWRQSVSSTPATRLDVINLQEQLDQKLEQRQARETGICQVSLLLSLPKVTDLPSSQLMYSRFVGSFTPNVSMN